MSKERTTSTMRAWQITTAAAPLENHLTLNPSVPAPDSTSLPKNYTLVAVHTTALNPVDYKIPEAPFFGSMVAKPPATPCLDYAGRVLATNNPKLKPDQLVFGRLDRPGRAGTLAEMAIVPPEGCIPIPAGVSVDQAAAIGTAGITAYQSLAPHLTSPGKRVFINGGSGGTGTFAIQIAKALGAAFVVASCSTANVELCESLGADTVLDYKSCDVTATLKERYSNAPSMQFDLVVDNVGAPNDLYKGSDAFLKEGGKFVQPAAAMNMGSIMSLAGRALTPGFLGGGRRSWMFLECQNKSEDFQRLVGWVGEGKMKSVVEETFAFEGAVDAFVRLKTGRVKGKLLVRVGGR